MRHVTNDGENHKPRKETRATINQWYHNSIPENNATFMINNSMKVVIGFRWIKLILRGHVTSED